MGFFKISFSHFHQEKGWEQSSVRSSSTNNGLACHMKNNFSPFVLAFLMHIRFLFHYLLESIVFHLIGIN
ncbi:hypothetical protein A7K93_04780 [Candidatus Methylacidiphilum fumarolicum]|nr:hypothetical protein A7K73_10985 [Candidatus Methylacidiphilum fumarolicum]TFE71212.1 hypothetical protein A7K72_11260 [Candidatus Methylacidiphilum fumarolicum]TFE74087.1 hypothetical protein A7K93_04780 [Candidatus Methylacidiphilum fumarolicum]TFE76680.1 hypothetical protein A7D33_08575 [Candidatus Methylacidiphilum fumarolicum]